MLQRQQWGLKEPKEGEGAHGEHSTNAFVPLPLPPPSRPLSLLPYLPLFLFCIFLNPSSPLP